MWEVNEYRLASADTTLIKSLSGEHVGPYETKEKARDYLRNRDGFYIPITDDVYTYRYNDSVYILRVDKIKEEKKEENVRYQIKELKLRKSKGTRIPAREFTTYSGPIFNTKAEAQAQLKMYVNEKYSHYQLINKNNILWYTEDNMLTDIDGVILTIVKVKDKD